ncbi:Radical SAM domain protein [Thalassoporum mexicanum PCC 7367]|uniref:arsenosugar biosynthesis radical SAM (seleno)protein ArsS n=1 Tax=Thalassoporum mexicanum TaxID=3457544 RepID=UPI00029F82CE|nr:arsenosugar biosynthesis radical SAM (seleno)protein ArsS [Pseudanabaena sp. PCC 7367]AFY68540.1 Radical SAM domain protein [Pseudanabaena sp. PCC 7367]
MQTKAIATSADKVTPFTQKLGEPLTKQEITVLQINLGKRCNLACSHCHVEAGPKRTEELSPEVCEQLIEVIQTFDQIETVDLTGGAPEMNYGFRAIAEAARAKGKEVIVRSNLTIYFEPGYEDLPEYCASLGLRIVASLPCYLEDNVDKMRGKGVYDESIKAIQILNQLGYGQDADLILDLVYNPALPISEKFSLPPQQARLEQDYKAFLQAHFGIVFNNLFTITNLPVGRTKFHLERLKLAQPYTKFLETSYNADTIPGLMCRNQLSIDYLGNVFDCDFNQMEDLPACSGQGEKLTVAKLLAVGKLDLIERIRTANFCYGCTAGSGSSCGGALL